MAPIINKRRSKCQPPGNHNSLFLTVEILPFSTKNKITKYKIQITNKFQITMSEITKRLGGENDLPAFAQKNLKYQPTDGRVVLFSC
jgi:hypothetical protein